MYSLCQWKYNLWQTRGITPNVRCWYKPINTNTVGPRTQEPIPLGGHLDAAPWSSHPPWTSAKSSNAVVALELLSPAVRGLRQQLRGLWDAVSSLFGPCSFWRKCRYVSHPDSYGNDLNTFTVQWLTYIHTIILNIILHACFGVTAHSRTLKKKTQNGSGKRIPCKRKRKNIQQPHISGLLHTFHLLSSTFHIWLIVILNSVNLYKIIKPQTIPNLSPNGPAKHHHGLRPMHVEEPHCPTYIHSSHGFILIHARAITWAL